MKIEITFKTPDAVENALQEEFEFTTDMEDEKFLEMVEKREKVESFLKEYIEYREYITIIFDVEQKTVKVKKL